MSGIRTSNNPGNASNLANAFKAIIKRTNRGRFLPTRSLPSGGMFRATGLCLAVSVPFWAGLFYLATSLL